MFEAMPFEHMHSSTQEYPLTSSLLVLCLQVHLLHTLHTLRTSSSELRIDDAVPFTTTPNHRIMVPSDGDDATVTAVDLKLGNWVMCSDRVAKKVVGMRLIPAAGLPEDFRVGLLFSHDSAMQASSILVLGGLSYTGFDHN
jgi:hypothetical protein